MLRVTRCCWRRYKDTGYAVIYKVTESVLDGAVWPSAVALSSPLHTISDEERSRGGCPAYQKLIEKIEDRLANKWGCWYERNKARVPLYAVLGGIGWYLYGMFLNSLKLGKESVFNTTGEVIESIWVFNPLQKSLRCFYALWPGVSAFIALMVCLITKTRLQLVFRLQIYPGRPRL